MLNWLKQFNIFCLLDDQHYAFEHHHHDFLLAAGVKNSVSTNNITELDHFLSAHEGWKFGHISYDFSAVSRGAPAKKDKINFPLIHFFTPQVFIRLSSYELTITASDPKAIWQEIESHSGATASIQQNIPVEGAVGKDEYMDIIHQLQSHLRRGDCYEINYCVEFFAHANVDPFMLFSDLMRVSPNPYSAFYRVHDSYLLCASPERFLKKSGSKILSQPMKGTNRRMPSDPVADMHLKQQLSTSEKDRAENVMIVDLVRNDLTRICEPESVMAEQLFHIQTFPQVHQMVSTVSGILKKDLSFSEIISATFPMGSMTGAPKHRVLQLINQYEKTARGIFSGAVGYFTPEGDFDFNVVIRSLMYHASSPYLSYLVGSGITIYSNPEQEWEECLLKSEGIKKVLTK